MYGVKLAEKLQSAGVEVVVSYPGQDDKKYGSITKFLIAKLKSQSGRCYDEADAVGSSGASPAFTNRQPTV